MTLRLQAPVFRDVTMADAEWVIGLAEKVYERPLDYAACRDWMAEIILGQRGGFFRRSDHCVGIALLQRAFHDPSRLEAHMLYLFAEKNHSMEGLKMLVLMAIWAKGAGAKSFHFGSIGKRDLSALAKRMERMGVNVAPDHPSWTISLNP